MHPIYRVVSVRVVKPYTLHITFDDQSTQVIDLSGVLHGEMYGPLRDENLFNQVYVDPEVQTVVWPNGADFDPATLHDWPAYQSAFRSLARQWAQSHDG